METSKTNTIQTTDYQSQRLNASRLLLPFSLGLIGACLAVHLVILARGNKIDLVASLLVGAIAVFYAWYSYVGPGRQLRQVRFGALVAHAITYVVVTGSFQLHAAILAFNNSDALRGDENLPLDSGWLGPTFAMAGFWAIGFVMHAIASVAQRGYEN